MFILFGTRIVRGYWHSLLSTSELNCILSIRNCLFRHIIGKSECFIVTLYVFLSRTSSTSISKCNYWRLSTLHGLFIDAKIRMITSRRTWFCYWIHRLFLAYYFLVSIECIGLGLSCILFHLLISASWLSIGFTSRAQILLWIWEVSLSCRKHYLLINTSRSWAVCISTWKIHWHQLVASHLMFFSLSGRVYIASLTTLGAL